MHSRRQVKRSILGSRVGAVDAASVPEVVHAVKRENKDSSEAEAQQNINVVQKQDESLGEHCEDAVVVCPDRMTATGSRKSSLKSPCNGPDVPVLVSPVKPQMGQTDRIAPPAAEDTWGSNDKQASRTLDPEKDCTRSVSLLEQKRKVVSSSIDVPRTRKSEEELDMDKVTAAMVLTSLSTSPLVRSPPVRVGEGLNGSWKEGGLTASSYSSSGFWSWSGLSDQSNPSTPSPPLSADTGKPFRVPGAPGQCDDVIEETDGSSLLFDEPVPRKRKNSMKVMFKCLWKNCGKVLGTAAGIQKHIRNVHLGRNCDSECSDGEEDFYYTEIKLNTDCVTEGLNGPPPLPRPVLSSLPPPEQGRPDGGAGGKPSTPLSRSAPSALYLVHTDHAYQATAPVTIAGSTGFTPGTSSRTFSVSWQSASVTFTGVSVSPTQGSGEPRPHATALLSSPPRAAVLLRKARGEGKKCRKVYGMENRDMWCTACRWKKACQRFVD